MTYKQGDIFLFSNKDEHIDLDGTFHMLASSSANTISMVGLNNGGNRGNRWNNAALVIDASYISENEMRSICAGYRESFTLVPNASISINLSTILPEFNSQLVYTRKLEI